MYMHFFIHRVFVFAHHYLQNYRLGLLPWRRHLIVYASVRICTFFDVYVSINVCIYVFIYIYEHHHV